MKAVQNPDRINVTLDIEGTSLAVGTLARRERRNYFQYDESFVASKLELSPFNLPLSTQLITFDNGVFEGLAGLFNDSLPDGWGRLLFDRYMRSQGVLASEVDPLTRLAFVGSEGPGALSYHPSRTFEIGTNTINLDTTSKQSQEVLLGETDLDVLPKLLKLNASSAGARPKIFVYVDRSKKKILHAKASAASKDSVPWMIKFASSHDSQDSGAIEYVYALMAQRAGVEIPEVHLFTASNGPGYFGARRFDRTDTGERLHMHSVCGLLHSDFRTPCLDYEDLITLTWSLTRDAREVEKMYRLAVFNVLAHNRDDHSKNFSFLMDKQGRWRLSPAYDLTFSSGPGMEASTMVMGEGRNPGIKQLRQLAKHAQIKGENIIQEVREALSSWKNLAHQHGVSRVNQKLITDILTKRVS